MPDEPIAARVARRLRDARIAAGLTVREAAARAGLPSHSLIVKYERGAVAPPLERLRALALAYGVTPAALLAEHDAAVPVIALLERASAAQLAQLARMLAD
jgi:transcriptional regulator with XRE-family HTH domain